MSEQEKGKEERVFDQKLNMEDLDAAAGGGTPGCIFGVKDDDSSNCVHWECRPIYGGGGFPNCAATVEEDSCCADNDACYHNAVKYGGMTTDCNRSWK